MSRRWNRHLALTVDPQALSLRVCGPAPGTDGEIQTPWDGARPLPTACADLLALAAMPAGIAHFRGWPLDIRIGNGLAHFDVVEGRFADQSDTVLDGIAAACVQELLGTAHGRETRCQLQRDERHLLLCALDAALLAALRETAAGLQLRLRRIETTFGRDWNRHGAPLAGGCGAFASASAGEATAALVHDGVIVAIGHCAAPERPALAAPDAAADGPTRLDTQLGRMAGARGVVPDLPAGRIAVVDAGSTGLSRWTRIEREAA